jgi:hypothetical protein
MVIANPDEKAKSKVTAWKWLFWKLASHYPEKADILKRLQTLILSKLSDTKTQVHWHLRQSKSVLGRNPLIILAVTPMRVSQTLTYILMALTLASTTYWLMHISQIPSPANSLANNFKGTTLYTNQDINSSYPLFGMKPLASDSIILRGVVITEKSKDGIAQGYALFEIDGKPSGAIALGDSMNRGMTLKAIDSESATVMYQGKEITFSLQKTKKENMSFGKSSSEIKKTQN